MRAPFLTQVVLLASITSSLRIFTAARLDPHDCREQTHHTLAGDIPTRPAELPVPVAACSFLLLPRTITGPGIPPCLLRSSRTRSQSGHVTARNADMRAPFLTQV
ncbi:hypothetical protein HPB48_009679 [Haemaphysalis longicornis]|uniref:Secreted protein n=1 Tax=Haemaphysalis longicornis TaxID=44386 RepID=A0A9J6GI61_HAELO|nr:hypothetical protein HPB48_009679 [Haemaphysalis longicornis]